MNQWTKPLNEWSKPQAMPPNTLRCTPAPCHAALTEPGVLKHIAALGTLINSFPDATILNDRDQPDQSG
jgi:hypothetical protein